MLGKLTIDNELDMDHSSVLDSTLVLLNIPSGGKFLCYHAPLKLMRKEA